MEEITREDMSQSSDRAVEETLRLGRWRQYKHYKIVERAGARYVYAPPARDGEINEWNSLYPLARHSADQFLQFARWVEDPGMDKDLDTPRNAEAAIQWAETFGVLGLNDADMSAMSVSEMSSDAVTADYLGIAGYPYSAGWDRKNSGHGGMPNESVHNFAFLAWEAHIALRLHEALVEDDLATIRSFMSTIDRGEPRIRGFFWTERDMYGEDPKQTRIWASGVVGGAVRRKVQNDCYPTLQPDGGVYRQGWGFRSLLGAMWLQMMWLVTGEVRRCEWCHRTIALEEVEQSGAAPGRAGGKRKTRSNRRFCPSRDGVKDKCKADWNYHRGTGKSSKDARKEERQHRKKSNTT